MWHEGIKKIEEINMLKKYSDIYGMARLPTGFGSKTEELYNNLFLNRYDISENIAYGSQVWGPKYDQGLVEVQILSDENDIINYSRGELVITAILCPMWSAKHIIT